VGPQPDSPACTFSLCSVSHVWGCHRYAIPLEIEDYTGPRCSIFSPLYADVDRYRLHLPYAVQTVSEDESTTASSSGSVVLTFLLLPRPFSAEKNVQLCFGASFNADK